MLLAAPNRPSGALKVLNCREPPLGLGSFEYRIWQLLIPNPLLIAEAIKLEDGLA